jgi:hypothetical protein
MAELLQHSRSSVKQWGKADKREGGRGNLRREVVNLMSAVGLAFCCRCGTMSFAWVIRLGVQVQPHDVHLVV